MSRALAATVALLLTGALTLPLPAGPTAAGTAAAAVDCVWQQHSKRIVKRVKRDGRARRIVRKRHWWSCNPLPAPPATGAPSPGAAPPLGPEPEPLPRRVSVKVDDATPEAFKFGLSRPYVFSGEVTVELNNELGQDPHNLNLQPVGGTDPPLTVGEAEPGESRVGRFDLAPGNYRLWCDLTQHEEWGMKANLEVRAG